MADLRGIEIFSVGRWKGMDWSVADLDAMVRNFDALQGHIKPPAKLGHDDEQVLAQHDGQPALGWVTRLYRQGKKLLADFADVPRALMEAINLGRYRRVSSEIFPAIEATPIPEQLGLMGTVTGAVLHAVAFLGADMPEVKDLADLPRVLAQDGLAPVTMTSAPCAEGAVAVAAGDLTHYATVRVPIDPDGRLVLPIHAAFSTQQGAVQMADKTDDSKTAIDKGMTREEFAVEMETRDKKIRADLEAQAAVKLSAKDAELAAMAAELKAVTAQQKADAARALRIEAERFADGLMTASNARITQAMRPYVVALFQAAAHDVVAMTATDAATAKCFSAGETPADLSVRECVLRLVAALPPLPIGERTTTQKAQDTTANAPEDWDQAVRLVAKEQSIDLTQSGAYQRAVKLTFADPRWAEQAKRYGRGAS